MKLILYIAALLSAAAVFAATEEAEIYSLPESTRNKRSIGKFFSDFFKRFQKKERRRVVYYNASPYGNQHAASYQTHSFGPPPKPHNDGPYAARHPSHVQPSNVGHPYGGGHFGNDHGGHHGGGGGYGDNGNIEIQVSAPHGGNGYGGASGNGRIPHGFGPLKQDDVIHVNSGSGSYVPTAPHITQDTYGAPSAIQPENTYAPPHQDIHGGGFPVVPDSYVPPDPRVPGTVHSLPHSPLQSYQGPANAAPVVSDSYNVPNVPALHSNSLLGIGNGGASPDPAYRPPEGAQSLPLAPHNGPDLSLGVGLNYQAPSNTYQQPANSFQTAGSFQQPTISYAGQNGRGQNTQNIFLNGKTGGEITYSSPLGPDDPIIEIVFQEGDPLPRPPPPRIDPKLYEPPQDDVEVFFIEYSPEDNLNDLQSLNLKGARPAILQDLPTELPPDLQRSLLNSGILENAQIEVIDLDRAITDTSLDPNTRNLLQNYYTRPRTHRQVAPIDQDENKTEDDVRVKRIKNKVNTPEGAIEVIQGLKGFRKGKFGGRVEVNDEQAEKFLPFTLEGKKFPLPKSIPEKDLSGVLLLAPGGKSNNKQSRQSPFFITNQRIATSGSAPIGKSLRYEPSQKDAQVGWSEMETTGWVPIVDS